MNLRTLTRVAAALAIVFAVLGGVLTALAPAGALQQDRITIDKPGSIVKDYSAIVGDNPGGTADPVDTITPDTCQAAGCDVIPMTIVKPAGLGTKGDYFVQVTLEWDTQQVNGVPVEGSADVDDMDLWLQNDPVVPDAGVNQDGFTYYSAGSSEPETVTMYDPAGNWNILVVNASGVNTGYRLTVKMIADDIPSTIFESLPPAFSGGSYLDTSPPTTTPPPAPVFDAPAAAPVDIAPAVPPTPDTDLSTGNASASSLTKELASPPLHYKPDVVRRPRAPSGTALLAWMLAFPLALLAAGGTILLRRQRNVLAVA